jgi:hypothetical protein
MSGPPDVAGFFCTRRTQRFNVCSTSQLTNPKCVRGSGATLQPSEARACTQSATIPKPGPLLALAPEDMRELSWTEASCAVERAEKWVLFPARVQHEAPPPPSSKFLLKPLRCRFTFACGVRAYTAEGQKAWAENASADREAAQSAFVPRTSPRSDQGHKINKILYLRSP